MSCLSPGPSTEGVLPENWVNEYLLTFLVEGQAQEPPLYSWSACNADSWFKLQDLKLVAGEGREVPIQAASMPGLRKPQFADKMSLQPLEEQKHSDVHIPQGHFKNFFGYCTTGNFIHVVVNSPSRQLTFLCVA